MSSGSPGEGQWVVPITLCRGSYEVQKSFLLEARSQTVDTAVLFGSSVSDNESPRSWIKINVDGAGFYRVKYDDHLSGKIRYAIESKSLSAMDRYGNFLMLYFWIQLQLVSYRGSKNGGLGNVS